MSDFKATLNDKMIGRLAPADKGERYVITDTELRGFFLRVGVDRKTFMVRGEFWKGGKRHTKKVVIGIAGELTTREARAKAKEELGKIAKGEYVPTEAPAETTPVAAITLRQAWDRYRLALERKSRSPGTIRGYRDHVEGYLKDWLDKPLKQLGDDPTLVAKRHDDVTANHGRYAANSCMRTLRAIYNHARRSVRGLPPENPVMAVDWNEESRRDVAMGDMDLPAWMEEAGRLRNPIRREFHLFTLLSGSRPTALKVAKVTDLSFQNRNLHIPAPKGGSKKAFDIPLSQAMMRCLVRAMRASRMLHPDAAETWIFAAESESGHLDAHREDRDTLSKWGNDLRHTYRTVGQAAGLSSIDMHLLMNHSLKRDVNTGYITRSKLHDSLRVSQEALSDFIIGAGTAEPKDGSGRERVWPLLASRRVGDQVLDPTPADPRVGVGWSDARREARRRKLAKAA